MSKKVKKLASLAIILIASIFVVGYTLPESKSTGNVVKVEHIETVIKNVSAVEFNEMLKLEDGIILDVRTKNETVKGHLKGASFIDFYDGDFEKKIKLIQKDKPIYIYCYSGARSSQAAEIMAKNGFASIYNLNGGFRTWTAKGYEVTTSVLSNSDDIPELSMEDFQKMLKTDQPVLIEFQTSWCAPCKKMAPIVDDLKKELGQQALIIKLDADINKTLAKQLNVNGVPEFIVFNDAKETWRHTGVIEAQRLREKLTE